MSRKNFIKHAEDEHGFHLPIIRKSFDTPEEFDVSISGHNILSSTKVRITNSVSFSAGLCSFAITEIQSLSASVAESAFPIVHSSAT